MASTRSWRYVAAAILVFLAALLLSACGGVSSERATASKVNDQMGIYNNAQPLPVYSYSMELAAVDKLYNYRVAEWPATWTVWYGANGTPINGCVSRGFGLPYGVSRTNGLRTDYAGSYGTTVTEQAEPNGLFTNNANSTATWVFCVLPNGDVYPRPIEAVVETSPYPIEIVRDERGVPLYVRDVPGGEPSVSFNTDELKRKQPAAPTDATP